MSKRNFLVSCAKSIFALATVVMMSMAFSACSKDNKDDEPQLKPNVLTINNREVTVKELEYTKNDKGFYEIRVFFDADTMEELRFKLKEKVHFNKVIDLSKKEEASKYWQVRYDDPNGDTKIKTLCLPDEEYVEGEERYPVFQKGTLFVVKKSDSSIHIKLEGKVDGTDAGAVYNLTFLYEGDMRKVTD